ncbi:hypothetical protein J437_LFUL005977 [Ladona fulva]|uniref:Kinetochore protein Spc24 n=1 Tax=Ladona fulva TaxID=123851 RepID=A0A8K0K083_LADFU|nr:hypothetical protein J437_LFUL005977 [Ladona fulva]
MELNNPSETIRNIVESASVLFSKENSLKLFESVKTLNFVPADSCKEGEELNKALEKEQEEIKGIRKETDFLSSEIKKCEDEIFDLRKKKKLLLEKIKEIRNEEMPSAEDQETLNKLKALCKLYKNVTGIHWDYSAPETTAKGYIVGPLKNYVHAFEFPANSDLPSKMWREIEKSSSEDCKGKENISEVFRKAFEDC